MVQVFVNGVLNFDVSKLKLQNRKLIQFMISKEGSTKLKNVRTMMYVIIAASVLSKAVYLGMKITLTPLGSCAKPMRYTK